jgi:hypothetical protein
MEKYQKNLKVIDDKVFSYHRHVATIIGDNLIQLAWWSQTTQKHINYVAKTLKLKLIKQ